MKIKSLLTSALIILLVSLLFLVNQQRGTYIQQTFAKPSFQMMPIATDIRYTAGQSIISLDKWTKEKHKLTLDVTSSTNAAVAQRHDLSLVYASGRLVSMLNEHQSESDVSHSQIFIRGEGSIRYDVISFHHATTKTGTSTTPASQVHLSSDRVYLLSANFASPTMFREAQTNTQHHWKRILDQAIQQEMQYQWNYLIRHFEINAEDYDPYPLMHLPGLLEDDQIGNRFIVGKIWEAIYMYYMEGEVEDRKLNPINSTMPLILLDKGGNHFLMMYRTADGEEFKVEVQLSI